MPLRLNRFGQDILSHGGHDDVSDDDLLLMELIQRAPGMSRDDYQRCFVALREEFGEDALRAIQTGHVKFEERAAQAEGQRQTDT
jgi:hypothetical protein